MQIRHCWQAAVNDEKRWTKRSLKLAMPIASSAWEERNKCGVLSIALFFACVKAASKQSQSAMQKRFELFERNNGKTYNVGNDAYEATTAICLSGWVMSIDRQRLKAFAALELRYRYTLRQIGSMSS